MNINEIYLSYANEARKIPGFRIGQKEDVPYDIQELADMYLLAADRGDESSKSMYFSALMVRYWHMTSYLYDKSDTLSGITREDMVDWLVEGLLKAFRYRSWQDPSKAVSKDKKRGAEKCFNQCITSRRQFWFKHYNQAKRKDDKYVLSMDAPSTLSKQLTQDGKLEKSITIMDTLKTYDKPIENICDVLIMDALDNKDMLTALVVDGMANQDTFVNDSKSWQPSRKKLMRHLHNLTPGFIEYFSDTYDVSTTKVNEEATRLSKMSMKELDTEIDGAVSWLRGRKEVIACM